MIARRVPSILPPLTRAEAIEVTRIHSIAGLHSGGGLVETRPFRAHHDIVPLVLPLDEFSFPSGHTLHAVTFTVLALAFFPMLAPLLIPFALLVAASRVVLGLHYPSDVLAATMIGCVLATTSLWVSSLIHF